jgi:hypothetical protein
MNEFQIRTCSDSLLRPGECCVCHEPATVAALTADLVEHARCERHGSGYHFLATKPLVWSEAWGPR